jgi:hypothetical protein
VSCVKVSSYTGVNKFVIEIPTSLDILDKIRYKKYPRNGLAILIQNDLLRAQHIREDGSKDMMKLISTFRDFGDSPNKIVQLQCLILINYI